jgi:hypothetical protein
MHKIKEELSLKEKKKKKEEEECLSPWKPNKRNDENAHLA